MNKTISRAYAISMIEGVIFVRYPTQWSAIVGESADLTPYGLVDKSRQEVVNKLLSSIGEKPLPDQFLSAFVQKLDFVEKLSVDPNPTSGKSQRALVGSLRYVIRNDRIVTLASFLDALKGVATLVVGILAVQSSAPMQATKEIIDGLVGLYTCFRDAIARGEQLPPEDFLIVATLKAIGPSSAMEIATTLSQNAGSAPVGTDRVTEVLRKYLETTDNKNGFTELGDGGVWRLIKV